MTSYSQPSANGVDGLAPLTEQQVAAGQRWMTQGEVKDAMVAEAEVQKANMNAVTTRMIERGGLYDPVLNPSGVRDTRTYSPPDLPEINFNVRWTVLACIKKAMRDAGMTEPYIADEVYSLVRVLGTLEPDSEDWRGFHFMYVPNAAVTFDKILDPTLPHAPEHIRSALTPTHSV